MLVKIAIANEWQRSDHVLVPTAHNERPRHHCGRLSVRPSTYKVMQKQSKHFSFRKTIRGVFSHSEKSDQYVCEWQQVSILLSLAKSDFHRFSRWRRSRLIGFDWWWKGCRNGCYRDFLRSPANGECFSHQCSLHCSGRWPYHTGTPDARCTFPITLLSIRLPY